MYPQTSLDSIVLKHWVMLEMESKNLPWNNLTQTANFSWCQLSWTLIETLGCLWRWLTLWQPEKDSSSESSNKLSVNQVRVWLKETGWSILLPYCGLKKKWQSAVVISQFWSVSEIVIVLFGLYMKFPNHFQLWNWKLKEAECLRMPSKGRK